uniref:ABC transmembrane type-1 domain-containing protein n=1 Tax=Astyanax mexicanus TaxID=7994 RepID=A0A8B9JE70_ASTMX
MRLMVIVACNLSFIFIDFVVTTVLYVQGSGLDIFTDDFQDFSLTHSVLDLWGTLIVRASLLLGGTAGVVWNRSDGPGRAANLSTLVVLAGLTVLTYALAKLLMFSEEGELMYDPWFLGLFSWTCVASVGTMFFWKFLTKMPERTSATEKKGAKGQPNSGATVGRLLSYCKKDSGLLTVAFFFLLLSAVCEAFIPYYTGQAIDGIVIHKSMQFFTRPMIILSVLALFR